MAQAAQLTTQQIQQKLEENHDYLVKIVAANQQSPNGLDAATQAKVDGWSQKLQQNLMDLAAQADKNTPAQPQATGQGVSPQKA